MAAGEEINDAVLHIAGSEIYKVVYFKLGSIKIKLIKET